jgi:hypothetical protein
MRRIWKYAGGKNELGSIWVLIKGSWEAILPCYGQIEIVRLDIDEGWCAT